MRVHGGQSQPPDRRAIDRRLAALVVWSAKVRVPHPRAQLMARRLWGVFEHLLVDRERDDVVRGLLAATAGDVQQLDAVVARIRTRLFGEYDCNRKPGGRT